MGTGAARKRIVLCGVLVVMAAALPLVITSSYQMHLVIMTCINIMLGLSFSLLYSCGLLTMAGAAFWAIGAYSSALLVLKGGLSFSLHHLRIRRGARRRYRSSSRSQGRIPH
jgi:branched-chain amino acid transport system permease protein